MSAPTRRRGVGAHGQQPIYLKTPAGAAPEEMRTWSIARGMTEHALCPLCDGHGRTHAATYPGHDNPLPPREQWCTRCTSEDREPCTTCGRTSANCLDAPEDHHCYRRVCLTCHGAGQRMAAHLWLLTQGLLIACARCQGWGCITEAHLHRGQRCISRSGNGLVRTDRTQPSALTASAAMRETDTAYWLNDREQGL